METSNYTLDDNNTVGCGCAGCQNGANTLASTEIQYQTTEEPLYAPSGAADPNVFANYLTHGFWQDIGGSNRSWAQNNITFSLNGFTAGQKDGLRMAFDLWADVADIEFTEVSSGANMTLSVGNDGRAYSSSSVSGTTIVSNNISIDTSVYGWSNFNEVGDYALMTALHEIGHSLGLGHTGNYNGSASYNNDAQWTNDTHQMTVMSYFNASNVGSYHGNSYAATPMLVDIIAIQNIYGADYTTRNGDTTYGYNGNTGRASYDIADYDLFRPMAIWDGGGIDTIDTMFSSSDDTIYLTQGDFSSVAGFTNNMVIAYGTVIENVNAGTGDDTIYGNDADNLIIANIGNDTIYGSLGNDTIWGDWINITEPDAWAADRTVDNIIYNYSVSDFAFNFIDNAVLAVTNLVDNFTDTLYAINNFIFTDGTFTFDELEIAYGELETVALRVFWSDGDYAYNSNENGTVTFTATDMGYGGSSGNQITLLRDGYDTTVTINDSNAPNVVRLYGSDFSDTLTINGTHNALIGQIYSGAGDDTITITVTGHDRIWGEEGDDTIYSGAGNDKIYGGLGDDKIYAGAGNDRLIGGDGIDWLYGDDGDDRIDADAGDDVLDGGAGNDKLFGYDGHDMLWGGDGADRIYGMTGDDYLYGNSGNDLLVGGDGIDDLQGGIGDDRLEGGNDTDYCVGGDGNDRIYGQGGNDFLSGSDGQDYIYGGIGNDEIFGGNHNDLLYGQDGDDILNGGTGHDIMEGGANNDILNGDAGIDRLEGGTGNDTLNGGDDNDILFGEDGTDILNGDAGNDEIHGGLHADTLIGGSGLDTLFGEGGSDIFGFTALDGNTDQIRDFTLTGIENDILNITDILTGYNATTDDINDFVTLNFKNTDRTDLFINSDGTGNDWEQTAIIRGSDFTGTTVDDLIASGQLLTDTTLL